MAARKCGVILTTVMILTAGAAATEVLSNDYVRVTVDPDAGGALTEMIYRKAMTFEVIADRGAGVAATGSLWRPRVRIGDTWVDVAGSAQVSRETAADGEQILTLTVPVTAAGRQLTFTRVVRMAADESGLRLTDTLANDAKAAVSLRLGSQSRMPAEKWRKNLRSWCGDRKHAFYTSRLHDADKPLKFATPDEKLFWRVAGQYGTGFLCTTALPCGRAQVSHKMESAEGLPLECDWRSSVVKLAAGRSASVTREILIDECGRAGNNASQLLDSDRIIVTVDAREAGMPGQAVPGAVTVVAAKPIKVKVVVRQYRGTREKKLDEKVLGEFEDTLQPGQWRYHHVDVNLQTKGRLFVEAEVLDPAGRVLAWSRAQSLVGGEGMGGEAAKVWKIYNQRIPHRVEKWDNKSASAIGSKTLKGSWREIGRMVAIERDSFAVDPLDVLPAVTAHSRRQLDYLKANYPDEAEMIAGAAEALNIEPERLAYGIQPDLSDVACMDVFFNGPDGPINGFSKERYGHEYKGLEHVLIIPETGYRFHKYLWRYGVNSAGLSFSGASANCGADNRKLGQKMAAEWKAAGKPFSPSPATMMATCKNVDEAIAFLTNPDAPYNGTANYLLVDRDGNAARIESAGILHGVFRYDPNTPGFLSAGNYQYAHGGDGLSVGKLWDWAANTMMRQRFMWEVAGPLRDKASLNDAIWIMETHGPGGMCQHGDENPSYLMTVTSFIAVCRTGELYLTQGWPCRTQYVRFTLDDK